MEERIFTLRNAAAIIRRSRQMSKAESVATGIRRENIPKHQKELCVLAGIPTDGKTEEELRKATEKAAEKLGVDLDDSYYQYCAVIENVPVCYKGTDNVILFDSQQGACLYIVANVLDFSECHVEIHEVPIGFNEEVSVGYFIDNGESAIRYPGKDRDYFLGIREIFSYLLELDSSCAYIQHGADILQFDDVNEVVQMWTIYEEEI